MPCVSADGKPTASGIATLKAISDGASTPEEVSAKTGQPLFRVRSGLRELKTAGYVEETEGHHKISESGRKLIQ
jgi:ribosomal protein S19E (S16A)